MFGSKIRSWMETHIVRPRKKGNKNKNGSSNNLPVNGNHTGRKANILQGDVLVPTTIGSSTSVASPARRSEVSPIQNHTASRFGWQSPQRESILSPKSDHVIHIQNPRSHTLSSPSSIPANIAAVSSPSLSSHQPRSPSNILLKSSFTLVEDSDNNSNQDKDINARNKCAKNVKEQKILSKTDGNQIFFQSNHGKIVIEREDNNFEKNTSKKTLIVRQNENESKLRSKFQNQNIQSAPENQYGKILPSKMCSDENVFSTIDMNCDNINANVSIPKNHDHRNHLINNNHEINKNIAVKSYINGNEQIYQHQQHYQHLNHNQYRNSYEPKNNLARSNRCINNTSHIPQNNHPLGHVINTLSSPESAYSTGYSTDGTSPGTTCNPPEYYINIRTGTHYFPKGVNALSIEASRCKFGLNKIEEMSPQDPVVTSGIERKLVQTTLILQGDYQRRSDYFDIGQNTNPPHGMPDQFSGSTTDPAFQNTNSLLQSTPIPSLKGFESPSPRQRCRIRTNPWYSTTDSSFSGNSTFITGKIEIDASSSSSGIKSSSDAGASDKNEKNDKSSDSEETSSSTEVEIAQETFSPGTIRRRKLSSAVPKSESHTNRPGHQDSEEDATLNEMMGKFDESYIYEKETDILSDSDPTDCLSDLDTGQDAGDECDTDDLLDMDFIDHGSIQEITEKEYYKNTGSCSYYNYQVDRHSSKYRRSRKQNEDGFVSKRKKRRMKTRKKSIENKEKDHSQLYSNRQSRSLGGTPVCLRRNKLANGKNGNSSLLTNRCNSLTLMEVHAKGGVIAFAESEKALLKADLEADVKYKQLIHEAETILVTMKTSGLRETPVASPRRIPNLPANKRVEMLRNCEVEFKREINKQNKITEAVEMSPISLAETIPLNKRVELLKYETSSAPNSPKCGRISPRKTHITNFINQNNPPIEYVRRSSAVEYIQKSHQFPVLKQGRSPSRLPSILRRMDSQTSSIYSDSDSEDDLSLKTEHKTYQKQEIRKTVLSKKLKQSDINSKQDVTCVSIQNEQLNMQAGCNYKSNYFLDLKKPSLMCFSSVDMGKQFSTNNYCPQSEPLKRKVYKGSSSFNRIKKSLDLEKEVPNQSGITKNTGLRMSQHNIKNNFNEQIDAINNQLNEQMIGDAFSSNVSIKQQLILDTIEDLKRSLEDQSVELTDFNAPISST